MICMVAIVARDCSSMKPAGGPGRVAIGQQAISGSAKGPHDFQTRFREERSRHHRGRHHCAAARARPRPHARRATGSTSPASASAAWAGPTSSTSASTTTSSRCATWTGATPAAAGRADAFEADLKREQDRLLEDRPHAGIAQEQRAPRGLAEAASSRKTSPKQKRYTRLSRDARTAERHRRGRRRDARSHACRRSPWRRWISTSTSTCRSR